MADRDDPQREDGGVKEALLFVPNVAKLVGRLVKDPRVPRSVKWGLALFGLYLASPIDLVPDWIPGLGYLDDVVLIALVGRWVSRRISAGLIAEHWDGQRSFPEAMDRLTAAARRILPERMRARLFRG